MGKYNGLVVNQCCLPSSGCAVNVVVQCLIVDATSRDVGRPAGGGVDGEFQAGMLVDLTGEFVVW